MDLQSITFYQISSSRSKGACFECFEVQYSVFILELKWCFFNCCFATQTNLLRFYAMTLLFFFSQTVICFEHLTTPFGVQYFSIEIEILSWLLFVFVLYCIIINAICTYIHVYAWIYFFSSTISYFLRRYRYLGSLAPHKPFFAVLLKIVLKFDDCFYELGDYSLIHSLQLTFLLFHYQGPLAPRRFQRKQNEEHFYSPTIFNTTNKKYPDRERELFCFFEKFITLFNGTGKHSSNNYIWSVVHMFQKQSLTSAA